VAEALLEGYFYREEEVVKPKPLLTGHDLLAFGIPEGPVIGKLLDQLREAQAAGDIRSREEAQQFIRAHWRESKVEGGV
jgi:hypothetical protein